MRFGGKRQLELVVGARDRCHAAGCEALGAVRCAYVDRRGEACRTAWCAQHWCRVEGRPYCRRHAGVVGLIGTTSHPLPDVDNRACSLAGYLSAWLDSDVRRSLQRVAPPDGSALVVDIVRMVRPLDGHGRRWSGTWKLVDHRGVLRHVSLEVDEADDRVVHASVDHELIGRGVPPWVERPAGGVDESQRRGFRDAVARSIDLVVTHREAVPHPQERG